MLKWHNKYDTFQDKGKYSMFGTSCRKFWVHITKILVSHIHQNTVSDEHTVSVQSSMQFLPTRRPVIVLHRLEEWLPPLREVMLSAVCLWRQKNYVILLWGFVWPKEQNVFQESCGTFRFLWSQIWRMISYIWSVECTL
jgi:hypothetical protein